MSAGNFVNAKYGSEYNADSNVHPIKVQPETIAATIGASTNAEPPGAITNPISAVVSKSARSLGLKPRLIRLSLLNPAGLPDGYSPQSTTTIPALTASFFQAAVRGAVCEYLNAEWTVVGKTAESAR